MAIESIQHRAATIHVHLTDNAAQAVHCMLVTSLPQQMCWQHVAQVRGSGKPPTSQPLSPQITSTLQYTCHSTPEGLTTVQQGSLSAAHLRDLTKHSACFDCGVMVMCLGSAAAQSTLTSTVKQCMQVMTADSNVTTINTVGYATMYITNIHGDLQLLPTGWALVDKHLHDLILPSAMLKDESSLYQGATLSHNGDFISLTDGDIIPLCYLLTSTSVISPSCSIISSAMST